MVITGATIIDGVATRPLEGHSIWIESGRIRAIVDRDELPIPQSTKVIDARGKYVIPGLMNANVHLLGDMRAEKLLRYEDRYEDLIVEGAQVALKNGVTTVFDTWGPRRHLMSVRDRIAADQVAGSRVFCAGNIVGLDGPFSPDFFGKAEIASAALVERTNALWVENSGPALSWMSPDQVASEVRAYIGKGIDFVKYASSEHRWGDPSTFLLFSQQSQTAIVEESHRAGITAQAHTTSIESLRVAVEAGSDLIQHCNLSGPVPIPESTLELMAKRRTGAVVFPLTQKRFDWLMETCPIDRVYFSTSDHNCRNFMRSGALLLLGTDGMIFAPDVATDPVFSKFWLAPGEDNLNDLATGHFVWFKAMEEKGCPPLEMLRAATINIATAYGKDQDLGTLQPGKIADMVVLDRDPLQAADNYRSIHLIIKAGNIVDRDRLPVEPIHTRPAAEPSAETLVYRAHRHIGRSRHPMCC